MKIVNMGRRNGKTTILIHTAYVTGYPIIVYDKKRAEQVFNQSVKMGFKGVEVITLAEWERFKECGIYKNVLIDEGKDIINEALKTILNANIVGITMTEPMITLPECEEQKGEQKNE